MAKKDTFQRIRSLDPLLQAVLAAYLCERMLPNYRLFTEGSGFGDPKVLRGALDAAWDKLAVNKGSDWQRWQEKIEAVTPSEHTFDLLGVFPAIAACTGLSSLLQGLEDRDASAYLDVSKISQGAVAHFLELGELQDIPDAEERSGVLAEHPLMQYEEEIQLAMLDFLMDADGLSKELIREVRGIAREEGISNLGFTAL